MAYPQQLCTLRICLQPLLIIFVGFAMFAKGAQSAGNAKQGIKALFFR
jgi:hypothetical protein